MSHNWEMFGLVSALVVWGGLSLILLAPMLKSRFAALTRHARKTPFRTVLGLCAVGILVSYAQKPASIMKNAEFTYEAVEGGLKLTGLSQYPSVQYPGQDIEYKNQLVIPGVYKDQPVVAIADDFNPNAAFPGGGSFASVTIPDSVVSVGDHFFGYGQPVAGERPSVTLSGRNPVLAVNGEDGVLYVAGTPDVVYAWGDIFTVRIKLTFRSDSHTFPSTFVLYKDFGVDVMLPAESFCGKEQVQVGWVADAGASYGFGAVYSIDAPAVFSPVWRQEPSQRCVFFNANGGTGEMAPQVFPESKVTLPENVFVRPGYKFLGWRLNNEGTMYQSGRMFFDFAGGYVFYAQWEAVEGYEVRFVDADGVTKLLDSWILDSGKVYNLPRAEDAGSAKRLLGWESADGRRYDPGMLVFDLGTDGDVIIFKAIWE